MILTDDELRAIEAEVMEATRRGLPIPKELEAALLHHEAMRRGLFPYRTFGEFVTATNPTLMDYEHVPHLIAEAEKVVTGETMRLLVLLPPRYFKSELFSRLLPAYFLRTYPRLTVGLASYGADLAWELSEDARDKYRATFGIFRSDQQAKKRWGTDQGGEMWASGVGGPILGRGYHLGVVDDPVDPEQAQSPTYQRRFRRWWPEKFLTRQEPGARIVFVMQRLGIEDPVDYLLRREVGDGTARAPEHWRVLALDEVRSPEPFGRYGGPRGLPETCTVADDWRKVGQILAPTRFSQAMVDRMQRDPITAPAQRQQRPMSPTGDFWRAEWFETYDRLPADVYNGGRDWDTAFTDDDRNSASAAVESYRGLGDDGQFKIYIEDVDWRWLEFPELMDWMKAVPGPHYVEAKASGKSLVQAARPHGVTAHEVSVKGGKLARASAVQAAVANKRVVVNARVLDKLLMGERQGLLRIAAEQLDQESGGLDVNDAFVQSLHRHLEIGAVSKKKTARVY